MGLLKTLRVVTPGQIPLSRGSIADPDSRSDSTKEAGEGADGRQPEDGRETSIFHGQLHRPADSLMVLVRAELYDGFDSESLHGKLVRVERMKKEPRETLFC